MSSVKKGKLFMKEVIARLKGDDAEVKASKIARKAMVSVESQIAALRSREVDVESKVEDCVEELHNAKFPIELIRDNQSYIKGISDAQAKLDSSAEELEDVRESIVYFQELLEQF